MARTKKKENIFKNGTVQVLLVIVVFLAAINITMGALVGKVHTRIAVLEKDIADLTAINDTYQWRISSMEVEITNEIGPRVTHLEECATELVFSVFGKNSKQGARLLFKSDPEPIVPDYKLDDGWIPDAAPKNVTFIPVIVEEGDWLSKFAEKYYGDAHRWPWIYAVNRISIDDPDLIYPGQIIAIPLSEQDLKRLEAKRENTS